MKWWSKLAYFFPIANILISIWNDLNFLLFNLMCFLRALDSIWLKNHEASTSFVEKFFTFKNQCFFYFIKISPLMTKKKGACDFYKRIFWGKIPNSPHSRKDGLQSLDTYYWFCKLLRHNGISKIYIFLSNM